MANPYLFPAHAGGNTAPALQHDLQTRQSAKTFADAAASYIEHGGEGRYLGPIIAYFGDRPLSDIHPFDLRQMATTLYHSQKNATRNRQALAPARAVMIHGYERGWCSLLRLRRFKEERPVRKRPASPTWLHAFARQCAIDGLPHLAAAVLFMASTGARVSEAISLRWREIDIPQRTALLLRTKTERNSIRTLTDDVAARLALMQQGKSAEDRVFIYRCRQSVNARIREVCRRAGISYKSSHLCGRHSFATNAIDLGLDIKTVMDAGRWRSSAVFLETYVHSRQNAGRVVADRFSQFEYDADI